MKRFIEGESKTQTSLFPDCVEDYVSDDNPVRVIEAFIDELHLGKLGFHGVDPQATGRPAYHPSTLLKIYVYGYLNCIHSSRRLERETQRNIELMWLTGRLSPDFKTIANFRKDNCNAIRKVCCEFVGLCRKLKLFSQALVAIDGSKFKAVNNRDRNFTPAKMSRRVEEVEMLETPDKQLSLTDPDARSMKTRGMGIVGYNVQTAVDAEHHLIVTHTVTNNGSDRGQLSSMAKQAKAAMGVEDLEVVADRGYFYSVEILSCVEAGITTVVPKPRTSSNKAHGLFDRQDFHYVPKNDEYRCPAGERLPWRMTSQEKGKTPHRYWSSNCQSCSLKSQCTTGKERRVTRWEHEAVLEAMQDRLDRAPEKMRVHRQTVEHPFDTLKASMGATHFLTKTIEHVNTEMSLHVLAYNLKPVMNILGVEALIGAIRAFFIALICLFKLRYTPHGGTWALTN